MSLKAIVFNDTSYDDHHGCQLVMQQLGKLAGETGIKITRFVPMRHKWFSDTHLRRDIDSTDLCIINGEGTMHGACEAALNYIRLAIHCRERGVPCFLINSVWQNNTSLVDGAKAFTGIFVRDMHSQAELRQGGIEAKVVPDLTLSYEWPEELQRLRCGYIVNGSVLQGRLDEAWRTVCNSDLRELRYLSIRTLPPLQWGKGFPSYVPRNLVRRYKQCRHLFSSYFRKFPAELDKRGLSRLRWRYAVLSTPAFLQTLSGAEGVITGRFHCVTLCMVTRTPFLALSSNTFKIEGLLAEAGLINRLCASYEEGVARRTDMSFSSTELDALEVFLVSARRRAREMFAAMASASASR
ncbi:polysaccharide pyruvyl transferase family protein [Stutzerimonas xanthomarina]|uniref:polysaccharide pyruvyl transferase family protein n=1 Tax=Stutzerimonas xanthomarina TaxID=271420 RepID=UPI003AA95E37